ncbi:GRAM domain-containing protein 1C [Collichthys lucidus]|uniref:GRAM domain-containing protein 1C n=1 Tax=Collichthys lucidus TaxID=240159 RepID=A0A4U5VI10_COLLU|nr:GRAM domain-containing protein 1C [Collichthys lucidus]
MDQVSTRSGVGSDDITDESTSLVDVRWSTDEEESSDPQGQCLAAPQTPLPTYKQRLDEFKKLFKEVPETERFILDYPCALQRDILLQGRLYLSENLLCFYSNVFRGTKPMTNPELFHMVKQHYGYDLGLSNEEMESLQISTESSMQSGLTVRAGGDDGPGRLERNPSLRLPGLEHGPLEASTPQGEDLPSPLGSQNSSIMEESRNTPTPRRSPVPSLDRQAPERVSKRSLLSLDLNANENGVSEQSGSESVEDEERVGSSEGHGRLYLNKVFHISANRMFDLLFNDSSFIRRFMNIRKITNASFTAWQKDASGNMKRNLNYTITISNPLIGKFSTATEYQYYLVESEVYTHDVPYHDYFYTQNRYCITRNSKRKCRLKVFTDVKYKKQPWGLVKSFITKNSWSGIRRLFQAAGLLILTLMNLGLFLKLWAMEDVAHRMYLSTKHRLREKDLASEFNPRQGPGFRTGEDMQLLKTVLQDSINLLEQLRSSLVVLQQNFALANRTAAPQ